MLRTRAIERVNIVYSPGLHLELPRLASAAVMRRQSISRRDRIQTDHFSPSLGTRGHLVATGVFNHRDKWMAHLVWRSSACTRSKWTLPQWQGNRSRLTSIAAHTDAVTPYTRHILTQHLLLLECLPEREQYYPTSLVPLRCAWSLLKLRMASRC
ncbi:hypothetical protein BDY19DRAFT_615948 [Irpex rosettiformis]|uniref:Uncharacterized protein n=1 Tax=Irpex rosettiformis TaxID=378272 RepID=A0ACB8TNZ8_9APHY|nr:hypothetical protein BDY19DRAFT_615948 [Irpex rosettiformis]